MLVMFSVVTLVSSLPEISERLRQPSNNSFSRLGRAFVVKFLRKMSSWICNYFMLVWVKRLIWEIELEINLTLSRFFIIPAMSSLKLNKD